MTGTADGLGSCTTTTCTTLRAAIRKANENADFNTIILPTGTYKLTLAGAGDDDATSGDLDIKTAMTIKSQTGKPADVKIDGNGTDRVFEIQPSAVITVTFQGVTIQNGIAQGDNAAQTGGGIEFEAFSFGATLVIEDSVIQNNQSSEPGGGVDVYGESKSGKLIIRRSIIQNNTSSSANGAGINSDMVPVEISDSTISGNTTTAGSGGGLYLNNANAVISGSTFSGNNHSEWGGGAIYSASASTVVTITNSTFSGNSSSRDGGAIFFGGNGSTLSLTNVTITDNHANSDNFLNGAVTDTGGGLYLSGGTTTAVNTIVASNTSGTGGGATPDNIDGGSLAPASSNNLIGGDPKLSALGNHGGPTQTHRLLADSPALDAGTATGAPALDQRGAARIVDAWDPGNKAGAPDIGAYEAHAFIADIPNQDGTGSTITINFAMANAPGATVSGSATGGATVTGNATGGTGTLFITPVTSGSITVTARVTDAAGYYVEDSFVLNVTLSAQPPTISGATSTLEDTQSAAITLTPQAADTTVTHFKISAITNGRLYKSNGSEIGNNTFITKAEGAAGLKFTPTAQFYGTGSFNAQAAYDTAGTGLSNPATASITVTAVNDAPSFTKGSDLTVAEDSGAQTVSNWAKVISAGPNEPDQTVSFLVSNDNSGLFAVPPAINTSGTLTYKTAVDANGSATVTVRAKDNGGTDNFGIDTSAAQTFTITVTPVNDDPIGDAYTHNAIPEDSGEISIPLATLLAGDKPGPVTATDEVGQTLSITDGTSPDGVASVTTTHLLFTPAADFAGTAKVTYTLKDSGGATSNVTIDIPVTPMPDSPWVDVASVVEDIKSDLMTVNISIDDGPEVTHFQIYDIRGGSVYLGNSTTPLADPTFITVADGLTGVRYLANKDRNDTTDTAPFAFSFKVAAATSETGADLSEETLVILAVAADNDLPIPGDDPWDTVAEDTGPWSIPHATLLANDKAGPDTATDELGQTLTIVAATSTDPNAQSVVANGTHVVFKPVADAHGTVSFTYTVQDSGPVPNTATATVTFTITEENDTPVPVDDDAGDTDEDTPAIIPIATLLANDSTGAINEGSQTLTFSFEPDDYVLHGTVRVEDGDVIFTPEANYAGPAEFSYTVTDNGTTGGLPDAKSSNSVVVSLNVTPVPDAPHITAAAVDEDQPATVIFLPSLVDLSDVTDFVISGVTGGQLYHGSTPVGATYTFSVADGATGLTFVPQAHMNSEANGVNYFTVSAWAKDSVRGLTSSVSSIVTITVKEKNNDPTANPDDLDAVNEDAAAFSFAASVLTDNDDPGPNESGQPLTVQSVTKGLGIADVTLDVDTQVITVTLEADFFGRAEFTYLVQDTGKTGDVTTHLTHTGTVYIPVAARVDVPTVTSVTPVTTAEETRSPLGDIVIERHAKDSTEVTGFLITGIANGTLWNGATQVQNDDTVLYADRTALQFLPDKDLHSPGTAFSFKVKATSSTGAGTSIDAATAVITVDPVNDAPKGEDETLTGLYEEDKGPWDIPFSELTANDDPGAPNEAGQNLTVDSVGGAMNGTVEFFPDAVSPTHVRFTPNVDFVGNASFTYFVKDFGTDNGGLDPETAVDPATVTIPVTAVNDNPVGGTDNLSAVNEDSGTRYILIADLLANDRPGPVSATDEAGQTLTLVDLGNESGGTVKVDEADPTRLIFTLTANHHGTAGFTYDVEDNGTPTGRTTVTVSFTVDAVAEAPVIVGQPVTAEGSISDPDDLKIQADPADGAGVTYFKITDITGGKLYRRDNHEITDGANYITAAEAAAGLKFLPVPFLNTPAGGTFAFTVQAALDGAGTGLSPGTVVTIEVTEENQAPVATDDDLTGTFLEDPAVPYAIPVATLLVNDTKGAPYEDGQTLTLSFDPFTNSVSHGTVKVEGGNVLFTPEANYYGPASFTYTVTDNGTTNKVADEQSAIAQVRFTISPVPDAPRIAAAAVDEDTPATVTFLPSLVDLSDVTDFVITGVEHGQLYHGSTPVGATYTFSVADGATGLTFVPEAHKNSQANGANYFTVSALAKDSVRGLTSPASIVTITVNEKNNDPTANPDDLDAVNEDAAAFSFAASVLTDNDDPGPNESGQPLTVQSVTKGLGIADVTLDVDTQVITVTLEADFFGRAEFTYLVQDTGKTGDVTTHLTHTGTVYIPVAARVDVPTVTSVTPVTTAEETRSPLGDIVIERHAKDSTEVTGFLITEITNGTLWNGATQIKDRDTVPYADRAALQFLPDKDLHSPGTAFSFKVQATSSTGAGTSTGFATVVIAVSPVNDAPKGVNETLTGVYEEDKGPWDIPFSELTANDDPGAPNEAGQNLTVDSVGGAMNGTVEFFPDAVSPTHVRFTPNVDFVGNASFTYIVKDFGTDNGGLDSEVAVDPATVTIPVSAVNDNPVGGTDNLSAVNEDSGARPILIADLLANDLPGPASATDEAGQTLTLVAVGNPSGGTVDIDAADPTRIIFTLTANHHGPAGFTYDVEDNGTPKGRTTVTVSFSVNPVADAPRVTAPTGPISTLEDTQSPVIKIGRSSVDGAEVTHFQITDISGGTLYHSSDINHTSQIGPDTFITVAQADAGLTFMPAADANSSAGGSFGFTVKGALDNLGAGLSTGTVVPITVTAVNDEPKPEDDTITPGVAEDSGELTIPFATLTDNDGKGAVNEGGQTLAVATVTPISGVGRVEVDEPNGLVRFTPAANFHGTAKFSYTVRDDGTPNEESTTTATVSIPVSPVADTPDIAPADPETAEEDPIDLVISRNAVDGAEVTHFQLTGITGGTLRHGSTPIGVEDYIPAAGGTATVTFTPDQHLNSPAGNTFSITVKAALDGAGAGLSATGATSAIHVTEVNDRPVGAADSVEGVAEDSGPWSIPFSRLTTNDDPGPNEAGQALTVASVANVVGGGGTVTITGTDVIFTPDAHFNGTAKFTYIVQDLGTTDGAPDHRQAEAAFVGDPNFPTLVTFTVTEVNDHPIATDDPLPATDEDTPLIVSVATLLANDKAGPDDNEDGQHLSITDLASDPTIGEVAFDENDPTIIIFTPALNYNGPASFTYTVTDDGTNAGAPAALTDTAVASFTVNPVNDAPVAADKNLSMIVGSTARSSVSATDVENDPLTYAVVDVPAKGTVIMSPDGTFQYTGPALGTFTFTYKANDGRLDSNVATVTIAVQPVPIVPMVTISAPVTLTREESIVVSGMANPGYYVTVGGTTVQANGSGNWSATVTLVEGPNVITATNGPAAASVTVVRDTKPPVITLTAPAERTDEESILLTATSEEGAKITIEGHEGATLTVSLKMGMNRFSATATDLAGNQATATVSVIRVGKVPAKVDIEPGKPGEVRMLNFKVEVPGEAVPQAITLQILSPSLETEAVKQAAGAAIVAVTGDADATGRNDGKPIHGLDDEATITFTYDPAQVANPEKLRIYYFDPKLKVWVELGGTVDRKSNTITVQVAHFTTFAAMEPRTDGPVLNQPPAEVREESLTVTGTYLPKTPVSLVINGAVQATATTDAEGKFTLTGKLAEGRNWVYVKSNGTLASREMTVHYRPVGYTDIGGHWAEAQIKALAKRGVVSLYPEPLFLPEEKVTRLEFAVMVARVLGLAPVDEAPAFTDTNTMPAWALPEMAAAVKAGIIKGMPDGSFAPFNLVTRAEMAIMLTRALNYQGMDITPGDRAFTDAEQIPAWAKDQVLTAARYGLITGYPDGSFQSGNSTTRAEGVTMLNRFLNLISRP